MKININDKYYINFDGMNYTPFKFFEGTGETYKVAGREVVSKDKWVDTKKYFMTLPMALKWVSVDSLLEENEEIDLEDYIKAYEGKLEELKKSCEGLV